MTSHGTSAAPPDDPPGKPRRESPAALYARRRGRFRDRLEALQPRLLRLGTARLVLFLVGIAGVLWGTFGAQTPRAVPLVVALAAFVAFAALVTRNTRLRGDARRLETLAELNERALARLCRAWKDLPEPPAAASPEGEGSPSFGRDLQVFGHASLAHLLNGPRSPGGHRTLAGWLARPAGPEEIRRRQEAVAALAPALEARQELEARAAELSETAPHLERFDQWLAEGDWYAKRPGLRAMVWAQTVAVPASFLAWVLGWIGAWWIPLAGASYLLSALHGSRLHGVFDRATAGGDGLKGYGPVFEAAEALLEEATGPGGPADASGSSSALLAELVGRLEPPGGSPTSRSAAEAMDRLERLIVLSDLRRGLFHFFVQLAILWDFHLMGRFEAWRREAGTAARSWLEALGELEALAALAALAHDHPEWVFPEVGAPARGGDPGGRITAEAMGHPLLDPATRVDNDLELGPPGTFLLVTGSNMSGKTTYLRALGTNLVLAQAGGPVCARSLVTPPVALATSVVVEDSLEEGVSYFMAELLRLKGVVDLADQPPPGRRVVYLLDEILRGTNSGERRIAVQRVLLHLLEAGALGMVTTHDLEILAEGALADAARTLHFRETLERVAPEGSAGPLGGSEASRDPAETSPPETNRVSALLSSLRDEAGRPMAMTFEYRARPGLAPTTNALRLLEAVGLGKAPGTARGEVRGEVREEPPGGGPGGAP